MRYTREIRVENRIESKDKRFGKEGSAEQILLGRFDLERKKTADILEVRFGQEYLLGSVSIGRYQVNSWCCQ